MSQVQTVFNFPTHIRYLAIVGICDRTTGKQDGGFVLTGSMMTKKIELTQGKFALVDDNVFEELNQYKWFAHRSGYAFYAHRNIQIGKKRVTIPMHRQILGLSYGDKWLADHINRNGLDNRSKNLRVVTKSENNRNRREHKNNTSGHRGITWHKERWCARIGLNGKKIWLGYHKNIQDAIEARKEGELKYWTHKIVKY